jgi:hypothetical protein
MTKIGDQQSQDLLALLMAFARVIQPPGKVLVWQEYAPLTQWGVSPETFEDDVQEAILDINTDPSITFARLLGLLTEHQKDAALQSLCADLHARYIAPIEPSDEWSVYISRLHTLLSTPLE